MGLFGSKKVQGSWARGDADGLEEMLKQVDAHLVRTGQGGIAAVFERIKAVVGNGGITVIEENPNIALFQQGGRWIMKKSITEQQDLFWMGMLWLACSEMNVPAALLGPIKVRLEATIDGD